MAKPTKHRGKWKIRWFEGGRRRSAVFDVYADAVRALREKEQQRDEVRRGIRAEPTEQTFGDLCDYWIKERVPRKRSGKDDESIIGKHLRPSFGAMRLRDITIAHVDGFINARGHLDKKTVQNHLTLLKTMFNVGLELRWLERAPSIPKVSRAWLNTDFRYLEGPADVRRFLSAAAEEDDAKVHALYAAAILTGMRAGELAGLEWADVSFERRLIKVQRSYAKPTKTEHIRYVPIGDSLLPILRNWRQRNPLNFVFPNADGRMLGESARVFQEILHRVLKRAGFEMRIRKGKLRHFIRFHELRHTFASHFMMNGGTLFRLQRILGHQSDDITQRYAHLAPDAYAEDHARLIGLVPSPVSEGRNSNIGKAIVIRLPSGVRIRLPCRRIG